MIYGVVDQGGTIIDMGGGGVVDVELHCLFLCFVKITLTFEVINFLILSVIAGIIIC